MTLPPLATPDGDATTRRVLTASLALAGLLVALKAFAYGTSGSTSVLVSLTESALDLSATGVTLVAIRFGSAPSDRIADRPGPSTETMTALVQVGLILASATFVGLVGLFRIFDPRPVGGGFWGVGIIVVSILLTGGLIAWQGRRVKARGETVLRGERLRGFADLGSSVVALIGVTSGALLNAPGLDAAAGLVIAVWLFWGGISLWKTAAANQEAAPVSSQ